MLLVGRALQEGIKVPGSKAPSVLIVWPETSPIPFLSPGFLSEKNGVHLSPKAPSVIKIRSSQQLRNQRRPSWDLEKQDLEMDH